MSETGIKLDDFFETEYINYSVYDNIRKIASVADGLKNASRKIVHTVTQRNISEFTKVSNLAPKIQENTEYLHGSIEGTVVNLAKAYPGSNNIPLLEGKGNFGSVFINDASASRYISARKSPILDTIFNKDDYVNLYHQKFEGTNIEPRFYMPVIPLLAINGADGVSVGFAQKILPRRLSDVVKYLKNKANRAGADTIIKPHWEGTKCTVERGESALQWIIKGNFERLTKTAYKVDVLPVGYTLKQYQNVLDSLVDSKVIKSYNDLSDNDEFLFEVRTEREFSEKSDEQILKTLKLTKTITENFTCIDETNKIIQFANINDMLDYWYNLRIAYNTRRKSAKLASLAKEMDRLTIRDLFIQAVMSGKLVINKRSEETIKPDYIEIVGDTKLEYFNQLMSIPVKSFTQTEIDKLTELRYNLNLEHIELSAKSEEDILLQDLKTL